MTTQIAPASLLWFAATLTFACSQGPQTVADGVEVDLIYVAKLADGTVVDQNPEDGPITFVVGTGKLQPKVELALQGMKRGEEKVIEVANAYGEYDPKKTGTIAAAALGADAKVGDWVQMIDGKPSTIKEIRDNGAILDLNHPLAGKVVTFEVKIVDLRKPEVTAHD